VQLTPEEEQRLYTHYGTTGGGSDEQAESAEEPQREDPDTERAGGAVAADDDAMTRSEEEVRIGKRTRERGRARLKKYVVTDYVEKKIPVKREEVRLERDPPAEGGQSDDE
jgi:stress response protein YsnF